MMWPLTVHPQYIQRPIVGMPNTVAEAKQCFTVADYGMNNDWLVRT